MSYARRLLVEQVTRANRVHQLSLLHVAVHLDRVVLLVDSHSIDNVATAHRLALRVFTSLSPCQELVEVEQLKGVEFAVVLETMRYSWLK